MEVVVEEAMFVGAALNFLILRLTARILKRRAKLTLLSALVGEIISLFAPLFQIPMWLEFLLSFLTAILMLSISFDFISVKRFSLIVGVFLLSSFVFGGACLAIKTYAGSFPLFLVAVIGAVVYFVCVIICKMVFRQRRRGEYVYKVKIKDKGCLVEEEGYLDSGNVLYDAVSGRPIMLITFDVFHKIYSGISLSKFLTKQYSLSSIKNGHYIKINNVGNGGNMLVFSVDEVVVGEDKSFQNVMLGLSFSGFEKSFGKNILLHCDMA